MGYSQSPGPASNSTWESKNARCLEFGVLRFPTALLETSRNILNEAWILYGTKNWSHVGCMISMCPNYYAISDSLNMAYWFNAIDISFWISIMMQYSRKKVNADFLSSSPPHTPFQRGTTILWISLYCSIWSPLTTLVTFIEINNIQQDLLKPNVTNCYQEFASLLLQKSLLDITVIDAHQDWI